MSSIIPSRRFYVYTLTDSKDKIFYVGKGCGDRVFKHEIEARTGCECHKCRKIRKLWRAGQHIRKYYVLETDDENEAYRYEAELIAEIGMKNLCNKAVGGRHNHARTAEQIADIQESVRQYDLRIKWEKEYRRNLGVWDDDIE